MKFYGIVRRKNKKVFGRFVCIVLHEHFVIYWSIKHVCMHFVYSYINGVHRDLYEMRIASKIYCLNLESNTSEHSGRLRAMSASVTNAEKMIQVYRNVVVHKGQNKMVLQISKITLVYFIYARNNY